MHWTAKIRIGIVLLIFLVPLTVCTAKTFDMPEDIRKEIKRLRSPKTSVRIDAARCLGDMGEKARPAVPFLIKLLHDMEEASDSMGNPTDMVIVFSNPRQAAAQALAKIKAPRAIGPLIDVVNLDYTRYGYGTARWALKEITGQDFRDDQERWMEWWEKNKNSFGKVK